MPRMNPTPRKVRPKPAPPPMLQAYWTYVDAVNRLIPHASDKHISYIEYDCSVCGARIHGTLNQRKHWAWHMRAPWRDTLRALFVTDE